MKKTALLFFAFILLISCGKKTQKAAPEPAEVSPMQTQMQAQAPGAQVSLGDIVPNDLVCMVNNDYMGREQLEVEVNGKTYYGCCEMCQERLPVDESVRVAVDPVSKNQVDKADAIIAVTGMRGEVSYFENEENYKTYIETILNK